MTASTIPAPRGRLKEHEPLAPMTWFRVGGPAEFLLRPADVEDLCEFLRNLPLEMPLTVIGAASNLIVRDGGINGVVIKLARGFGDVEIEADGVIAGAAALDVTVSEHAAAAGLTGLEFLSGIPGTIGGAVAMNAGAYGGDMAGVLDWVEIVIRGGALRRLSVQELGLSYRHSNLPADAVVVRARMRAQPGDAVLIATRMGEIKAKREATQPVRARTGGSTFANPDGQKAWELVDAAGCRGLTIGKAQISDLHCNFLLNLGGASAAELEGLGEEVRRRVEDKSGVKLRWEIKRIGVPA
ncbi:UDP-N-acetylmuramate dehydrogenase [Acidocella aminolytica]|uniref:UDP-N-acetylenolpyruvoylglucosamine reductase n=1 Tax=Acidocella aminolytica 101 = DSM 11237 TaxID=1120923 RepID=A0A0D6PBQ6_9PROT|nr:UDP-N-acetylmuramate dehydrogenase [Acidocella aminolytica]GAN79185.1 UDP-N-acetylenolpyruvoylglucosamine reductase [Acidocella aminolytica 101 = DSM 11237]SHE91404.1 UDP-N-acetylmuramate dehydrogenase [Acidocella aminolytica 101 = DSM 11237]